MINRTFNLTLISYLFLSTGLAISYGFYDPWALGTIAVGLLMLLLTAIISGAKPDTKETIILNSNIKLMGATALSLVLFIFSLATNKIYLLIPKSLNWIAAGYILVCLTLFIALFILQNRKFRIILTLLLIIFAWLLFSIWILHHETIGLNDVWYVVQDSSKSLLSGKNPYLEKFKVPLNYTNYQVGQEYVWPPWTLIISTPFYWLFKEVRYADLVCELITGFFLWGICRRTDKNYLESAILLSLFLFNPLWYFVLQQTWTEPTCIVLLFCSIFLLLGHQTKPSAISMGIFLASKQYLIPLAIIFWKLFSKKKNIWIWITVGFVSLLLPFVILSPIPFFENNISFQWKYPFRADSLSLPALLFKYNAWTFPNWLSYVVLLLIILWGLKKAQMYQIILFSALAYYIFFFLSKRAFCNYYFFVQNLLILGLALMPYNRVSEDKR